MLISSTEIFFFFFCQELLTGGLAREGLPVGHQCSWALLVLTLLDGVLATLQLNSRAVVFFCKNQTDCHLSN